MAIQFNWYENPKQEADEPTFLHARFCGLQKVDTAQLAKEIQQATTLSETDVKAVLYALSRTMGRRLAEGCRVHLDGLGYFTPAVTTRGKATPDMPLRQRNRMVAFKGVEYVMDGTLRESIGVVQLEHAQWATHSPAPTPAEVDVQLTRYFADHDFLTRSRLEELCHLRQSKALQWLRLLVEQGRLVNKGTPRNPIYVPAPGCYGR